MVSTGCLTLRHKLIPYEEKRKNFSLYYRRFASTEFLHLLA